MAIGRLVIGPLGKEAVLGVVDVGCAGAGAGDSITCRKVPRSSTICCSTWPGGTCTGRGTGGEPVDTIRTVAGPVANKPIYQLTMTRTIGSECVSCD